MVLPPRMYISFIPKFLIKWKRQAGRGKKRGPYTLDRRIDWIVSTTRTSPLRLAFRNRLIRYPIYSITYDALDADSSEFIPPPN